MLAWLVVTGAEQPLCYNGRRQREMSGIGEATGRRRREAGRWTPAREGLVEQTTTTSPCSLCSQTYRVNNDGRLSWTESSRTCCNIKENLGTVLSMRLLFFRLLNPVPLQ